jgi:hypothetical protein
MGTTYGLWLIVYHSFISEIKQSEVNLLYDFGVMESANLSDHLPYYLGHQDLGNDKTN